MSKDWDFRETVADDEDFLWKMLFYASHSDDEPDTKPEDVRGNPDLVGYVNGWRLAGMPGIVAERDGIPLGAAWLRLLTEDDRLNPVFVAVEIPELAVAVVPGNEGRGVGTGMIERLLSVAGHRYPGVVLSARAESPAVRLYERLGFGVVGEMTNRVGSRSVKMTLPLENGWVRPTAAAIERDSDTDSVGA